MNAAQWFVAIVGIYALIGMVFAIVFVTRGVHAVDPNARGGPFSFRALIFPASAALWPLLAGKWYAANRIELTHQAKLPDSDEDSRNDS